MPVDTNLDVLSLVEERLRTQPEIRTSELQALAAERDPAIADLPARQFHGRYRLRALRLIKRSGEGQSGTNTQRSRRTATTKAARSLARNNDGPKQAPRDSPPSLTKEQVRSTLLAFARELTKAESRSEIVAAVGRIDYYAEQLLNPSSPRA